MLYTYIVRTVQTYSYQAFHICFFHLTFHNCHPLSAFLQKNSQRVCPSPYTLTSSHYLAVVTPPHIFHQLPFQTAHKYIYTKTAQKPWRQLPNNFFFSQQRTQSVTAPHWTPQKAYRWLCACFFCFDYMPCALCFIFI